MAFLYEQLGILLKSSTIGRTTSRYRFSDRANNLHGRIELVGHGGNEIGPHCRYVGHCPGRPGRHEQAEGQRDRPYGNHD